ncbi:hypothetical protein [Polymorphospora lycopeni]|uniref:Uncharacterized protein n=1 Tax=Polymorphospora lycopeni TaxID=3140240 RepID=A0ABV5CKW4_9ACTN
MRKLLPFGDRRPTDDALSAVAQAEQSGLRAERDREMAAQLRREAEIEERKIRGHNVANSYDEWLQNLVQGRG